MAFEVTFETTVTRSPEPVETTVGEEVVLMSLASGECFGLGETGSAVWRLLAEPEQVFAVIAALKEEYDAPAGVLETDVVELVEEMAARGLVVLS